MKDQPETLSTELICGIAKKYSLELEKYALQSHAAVVVTLKTLLEHRQICLQNEQQAEQVKANEEAMAEARAAHAKALVQRQEEEAERFRKQQARMHQQIEDISKSPKDEPQPVLAQ